MGRASRRKHERKLALPPGNAMRDDRFDLLAQRPAMLLPDTAQGEHVCCICGAKHSARQPHNADSLFYLGRFLQRYGREPTWADACAHLDPVTRQRVKRHLLERGDWTHPAAGEAVIQEAENPAYISRHRSDA